MAQGIKITNYPEYIQTREEMQKYLLRKINEGARRQGSQENLSLDLGYSSNYISRVLKRGKFSTLERTYKEMVRGGFVE